MRKDAQLIIDSAIKSALPHTAVTKALSELKLNDGRLILIAIGKAAWSMAKTASDVLESKIDDGVVITKYDHAQGPLDKLEIFEAGHPISDDNTYLATKRAIEKVSNLSEDDTVLLLISGGGSALFEDPLLPESEIVDINHQLLNSGASIVEMNTIRKRLSRVKGGKFANLCQPAKVFSIVLSDIIDDPLDMIASGPAYPDSSTSEEALEIVSKYQLNLSDAAIDLLKIEPVLVDNVETHISGSVNELCEAAASTCLELGYKPIVLTSSLACEAKEAGKFLGSIAKHHQHSQENLAFIAGGETIVRITGDGKGGRNQEIALASANEICGINNALVFSIGSDGTDGPTDAAGGIVDGKSNRQLKDLDLKVYEVLQANDSYHALSKIDGLVITGPTGTNVNDISVLLIKANN